jgi:hypothetical protein
MKKSDPDCNIATFKLFALNRGLLLSIPFSFSDALLKTLIPKDFIGNKVEDPVCWSKKIFFTTLSQFVIKSEI